MTVRIVFEDESAYEHHVAELRAEWAAGRAETTTATVEDVARVLGHEDPSTDHTPQAQALAAAGLLTRPLPGRDEIDRAVGAVLFNAMNHPDPVAVLGRDTAPLRTKVTDAVLALLTGGESR